MTDRQVRRRGNNSAVRRRGAAQQQKPISGRERLRLAQFVICAVIFISVVAVKLLLPGKLGAVRDSVSAAMSRNMDVTEVFSAVGKAFSGKENFKKGAREVYQAVFHPESGAVETAASIPADLENSATKSDAQPSHAKKTGKLSETAQTNTQKSKKAGTDLVKQTKKQSTQAKGTEAAKLACVLYTAKNCPKNVCLDQAVLGFHYCTPVQGILSSAFGYREHPIDGEERFHYGIDIAADAGTAIKCFADGVVTVSGESTSYGKYLMVAHKSGYTTLYAHCSKLLVPSGTKVREGEKIAEVGETGIATGPHLHFELHQGSTYLDPIYYVTVKRVS